MSPHRKVVCVLKSGGDFGWEYVERLRRCVLANAKRFVEFHCYTDLPLKTFGVHPLIHDLPGWWSQMEAYRMPGPTLYLDLDTIVVDDLMPMFDAIEEHDALVLEDFLVPQKIATGVVGWKGDMSWLLEEFLAQKVHERYASDESWIMKKGLLRTFEYWQNHVSGIYSYKKHFRNQHAPPDDPRVVCFHGKPRPHEVGWSFR